MRRDARAWESDPFDPSGASGEQLVSKAQTLVQASGAARSTLSDDSDDIALLRANNYLHQALANGAVTRRGEALFLPDVLDDFQRVVALAPSYRDILKRRDIAIAMLRPDRPLAGALRDDGWRVLASDPRWVLLSRP